MEMNLHRATVERFDQTLGGLEGVLAKGLEHATASSHGTDELVQARLRDDMAPLHFQVVSSVHHSLGALQGVEKGEFNPPPKLALDYAGLQALVVDARAQLATYSAKRVDEIGAMELEFRSGQIQLPFVGSNFLLSFSLPNFFFHATTAYDVLRVHGVELGKRDFLGQMLFKQ